MVGDERAEVGASNVGVDSVGREEVEVQAARGDMGQGFFLGRPGPAGDVRLEDWPRRPAS